MMRSVKTTGTIGLDGKNTIKMGGRFTNTVVPRVDGGGCRQQHVFERMCAADPQVRSRLCPCGRRLVSAD